LPGPNRLLPRQRVISQDLTVNTLTTSGGVFYLHDSVEGNIERVGAVIGYDDLFLKSNAAENASIHLAGSHLRFWSGGGERWTIDSTGTLTTGSVPWARLTSFPSDCLAGQYVSGIGSALICSTPAGGDITAVTAGTGLTGGGTEGDVTLNVDDSRFINTTGDDLMTGKLTISRNIDKCR